MADCRILPERRFGIPVVSLVAACLILFGLVGCRTIEIGGPVEIDNPPHLAGAEAQKLISGLIDGKRVPSKSSGPVTRLRLGHWRVERWIPGLMVAAYSWQSHILRVNITFENHKTILEIGESEKLSQSDNRIHKRGKALAMELAQDIRIAYANIAMHQQPVENALNWESGSSASSFCRWAWASDPQEQAACRRAQARSYDRLQTYISEFKINPESVESKRLKACYAGSKTRAGADWEAAERCFFGSPASTRY